MAIPAIIADEMRVIDAPVPDRLEAPLASADYVQIATGELLLRAPGGTRFHYRKGIGVAIDTPSGAPPKEVDLFYHGYVYGTVAWMNGLVPLHASSVIKDGRIIAFTGQSGEGKSTLAAALSRHGFEYMSDDVLLVEPDAPLKAWSDNTRIKLWGDALDLTGASALEQILPDKEKYFATLDAAEKGRPERSYPLTDLILLRSVDEGAPKMRSITGAAKMASILEAAYRLEVWTSLGNKAGHQTMMLALANGLKLWILERQRDRARFADDIASIAELVAKL